MTSKIIQRLMIVIVLVVILSFICFAQEEVVDFSDGFEDITTQPEQFQEHIHESYGDNINLDLGNVEGIEYTKDGVLVYNNKQLDLNSLEKYSGKDVVIKASEAGLEVYVEDIKLDGDVTHEMDYEISTGGVDFPGKLNLEFSDDIKKGKISVENNIIYLNGFEGNIKTSYGDLYLDEGDIIGVTDKGFAITGGAFFYDDPVNGEVVVLASMGHPAKIMYDGSIEGGEVEKIEFEQGVEVSNAGFDYDGEETFVGIGKNSLLTYKEEGELTFTSDDNSFELNVKNAPVDISSTPIDPNLKKITDPVTKLVLDKINPEKYVSLAYSVMNSNTVQSFIALNDKTKFVVDDGGFNMRVGPFTEGVMSFSFGKGNNNYIFELTKEGAQLSGGNSRVFVQGALDFSADDACIKVFCKIPNIFK